MSEATAGGSNLRQCFSVVVVGSQDRQATDTLITDHPELAGQVSAIVVLGLG